ncbi:MAG: hypothetical protein QM752_04895 [Gammaproteobacteria bacterium]
MHCCKYTKLHALSLGFAFGILGAIMMVVMALFAMVGHGTNYVNLTSSMYVGYGPTVLGAILGAIWGFLEMFVFGILLAALYNCFVCKVMRREMQRDKMRCEQGKLPCGHACPTDGSNVCKICHPENRTDRF